MLIECFLTRDGGTHAPIDGTNYHFAPQDDGTQVCEVENPEHAQIFLSITEAYRIYAPAAPKAKKGRKADAEPSDTDKAE